MRQCDSLQNTVLNPTSYSGVVNTQLFGYFVDSEKFRIIVYHRFPLSGLVVSNVRPLLISVLFPYLIEYISDCIQIIYLTIITKILFFSNVGLDNICTVIMGMPCLVTCFISRVGDECTLS